MDFYPDPASPDAFLANVSVDAVTPTWPGTMSRFRANYSLTIKDALVALEPSYACGETSAVATGVRAFILNPSMKNQVLLGSLDDWMTSSPTTLSGQNRGPWGFWSIERNILFGRGDDGFLLGVRVVGISSVAAECAPRRAHLSWTMLFRPQGWIVM